MRRKEAVMNDEVDSADTVEIPLPVAPSESRWPETGSAQTEIDLAGLSHQGLVRPNNEDHFLIVTFGRRYETLLSNLPAEQVPKRAEEVGYAVLVADGMGGAAGGETASRMAISNLVSLVLHTPDWILHTGDQETERVMERMADRYRRVDASLREQGSEDPTLRGMGTTMTVACSLGTILVVGHIGDSRAYLFRDGSLHQLTRDHTLVQALVDAGRLTAEEAAKHPYRHMLTRYLGGGKNSVEGDFQRVALADGDQLLLCTDGLTEMADNPTIESVLKGAATAREACDALLALALKKGGKDNVTVALARYRFPQPARE
jgi:protein phosphatase